MLILSPHEMKYIWYLPMRSKFSKHKAQPNFFLGRFSFDLTFAVCLLGITLGVLHLENGLESYFDN